MTLLLRVLVAERDVEGGVGRSEGEDLRGTSRDEEDSVGTGNELFLTAPAAVAVLAGRGRGDGVETVRAAGSLLGSDVGVVIAGFDEARRKFVFGVTGVLAYGLGSSAESGRKPLSSTLALLVHRGRLFGGGKSSCRNSIFVAIAGEGEGDARALAVSADASRLNGARRGIALSFPVDRE